MRPRFPLYAKILAWFFLNLAVLAALGWVLVRSSFSLGLDSALLAHGASRVHALLDLVIAELRETPRADWDGVLGQYSAAYGVGLRFYQNDGERLAGPDAPLPEAVQSKLLERPAIIPMRPGGRRGDAQNEAPRAGPPEDGRPEIRAPLPQAPKFLVRAEGSPRYWLLARGMIDLPERRRVPVSLVAASSSIGFNGLLVDFRPWFVAVGVAAFVSALFWWPLVRGLTRAIAELRDATRQMAEGRFDVRVDEHRRDELGALGHSVNQMADRLGGFVTGQRRFLGDIAHELCSPLAKLRVALGILEERGDEKQRAYVATASEKAAQMAALVNELLSFSKAALGGRQIQLQSVSLREIAEAATRIETGDGAGVSVEIDAALCVKTEPDLLLRALANLVRNAIRYAGDAGPVSITAAARDGSVTLSVADRGPGVAEAELARLFDPFYRVDASRDRQTGGVGLGLAIVKTCVEACGGTVRARNRKPRGLQVDIVLPAC